MPARTVAPVTAPRCAVLLALALVLCVGEARGALPEAGWKEITVGVLPVRSYVRGSEDLFVEGPDVRALRLQEGVIQKQVEELLARRDQVVLVRAEEVAEVMARTRGYTETMELARGVFSLGLERYRGLQVDAALEQFAKAEVIYRRALADVFSPHELADLLLYIGLAHSEVDRPDQARVAFTDMLLLDPSRRFQRGYYPPAVERGLEGALVALVSFPDKTSMRYPIKRLPTAADRVGVDVWVMLLIEGTPDRPVLAVTIFDRESGGIALSDRIALSSREEALERLDRDISRWHTCAVEVETARPMFRRRPRDRRAYLDLSYAHTLMLQHARTREIYHAPGAALGFAYEASRYLLVYGRFVHMVSLMDPNLDLVSTFQTSRLSAGVGLTGGSERLRFYATLGVEVALSATKIEATRDVDCKHFGSDHPRCGGLFTLDAPGVWFGPDFALGMRWRFAGELYLHVGLSVASYVLEGDLVSEFNFPLQLSLGGGVRF